MKSKKNHPNDFDILTKKLQKIKDAHFYQVELPDELPLEIILQKCLEAWGVERNSMVGKINHSNKEEKCRKYCYLFACNLFSDKHTGQIKQFIGYGSGASAWGCERAMHLEIKSNTRFAGKILMTIKSLIDASPKRFKKMLQIAEDQRKQQIERKLQEQKFREQGEALTKSYVEMLKNDAAFYRDLYMLELKRPNRIGSLLHQPLIGPNVTNMMKVVWQTGAVKKGPFVDKIDGNRIYEFGEVRPGERSSFDDFDKDIERFIEIHSN